MWPFRKKETRQTTPFYPIGTQYFSNTLVDNIVQSALNYFCLPAAELPLHVTDGQGKKLMDHRLASLLMRPSRLHNRATFYSRLIHNFLLYGEAICQIADNELYLFWNRGDAYCYQVGPLRSIDQRTYYRSGDSIFMPEDVLHVRQYTGSEYKGIGKTQTMADIISALKQKTINQIVNGFNAKGLLTGISDTRSATKVKQFQTNLKTFLTDQKFAVLTMPTGQELKSFNIDLKSEQFISLKRMLSMEIYGLFNIPVILSGMTEKSIVYKAQTESLAIFIRTSLSPTLSVLESEMTEKLLSDSELRNNYKIQFSFDDLLRGDMETLLKTYSQAVGGIGFLSQNEVRQKLGLETIEGGDRLYDSQSKKNT